MVIERVEDIRRREWTVDLLVRWHGFEIDESGCIGIDYQKKDVPERLQEYLYDAKKNGKQRNVKFPYHYLASSIVALPGFLSGVTSVVPFGGADSLLFGFFSPGFPVVRAGLLSSAWLSFLPSLFEVVSSPDLYPEKW